jgi:hypothetical protein
MAIFKLSNSGVATKRSYTSALAGNETFYPNNFESIATTTVGSGGASSITFSSIPSTYTHLQLRVFSRAVSGGFDQIYMRINGDTGSNYSKHNMGGSGASGLVYGGSGGTTSVSIAAIPGSNQSANVFGASVTDFLDYTNTNKYKTTRAIAGTDNNGTGYNWFASGLWQNTNAITSINIFPAGSVDWAQYTHAALYGIKE